MNKMSRRFSIKTIEAPHSFFAIFILAILLLGYCTVSGQTIPENIPKEHLNRYNEMDLLLDKELIEWKPLKYNALSFCAHHLPASEQMVNQVDASFDLPFLEMLKETGIDCVRISIFPYNYDKHSQRYDSLIAKIKENNLKLMIAYMVGNLPEGTVVSFEQYKKKELDFTEMFIKKHNPDYYAVVTEPITMEKRIKLGQRLQDAQWIRLVEETTNLIKNINPGIKTMAAVNTESGQLDLAKKFASIENLDIVGFQLYGPAGMYKEYNGWIGKGEVVTEAIEYVKTQEKDTWITETWLSIPSAETWNGTKSSNRYFNEPFIAPLDAKWLKSMVYYAQKHNIKGVSPFFTGKFISYPSSDKDKWKNNFLLDFNANKRTLPFYIYKDIIREVKNKSARQAGQLQEPK